MPILDRRYVLMGSLCTDRVVVYRRGYCAQTGLLCTGEVIVHIQDYCLQTGLLLPNLTCLLCIDGVIVTGTATGAAASPADLDLVSEAAPDLPGKIYFYFILDFDILCKVLHTILIKHIFV